MDWSPPDSFVHGISQARILEWVAISARGSLQPRDQTCISCVSCIGKQVLYHWVICSHVVQGKEPIHQCRKHRFYPCWDDPLEKEMATHSSILAWEIPWTEEPGRLQPMG